MPFLLPFLSLKGDLFRKKEYPKLSPILSPTCFSEFVTEIQLYNFKKRLGVWVMNKETPICINNPKIRLFMPYFRVEGYLGVIGMKVLYLKRLI